jgi:exonuclease SbcC
VLITRIELQNTKSYSDDVIAFTEGTNAICGENGAGKSTLLEAIGFALFDYLPYAQADFVREGEKTATISVSFVSNQDGREYQVVRRCGGSSNYYVYDAELDTRIVDNKADVLDWLKEHLGVEPTSDLNALFRDAVGVPQGLLTAPFLQTPSQRKPLFDRLLRVDEYEQVWKALRETLRYLEEKLAKHRETIAGLKTQVQRLPGLRQRLDTLSTEVTGIEAVLTDLGIELGEAIARRESLETTQKALDDLTKKSQMLDTRLEGIAEQLMASEKAVSEAETAQTTVESSRSGYETFETAQAMLLGLEADRTRRDQLQGEWTSQEKSLALARERMKGVEANLREVEEAEQHMEALRPQVEQQRELEAALKTAQEQIHLLDMAETRLNERQKQKEDLQLRLGTVETGLRQAEQVAVDLRDAQTQQEEARRSLTDLKSEGAALKAEVARLAEQAHKLEATEAAVCPVCERALTPQHRAELLARNQAQLDELEIQDQTLVEKVVVVAETSAILERQIQDLEAQLRDLPRPADQEDLIAQIASLEDELTNLQAETVRLSESRDDADRLEQELAESGDPSRQYERMNEKAGQRVNLEEQLEADQHAISALEASLAETEQALAPYADLDQRLSQERATLSQHEEDHRRYLQNVIVAADLDARRNQSDLLRAQEAELKTERDELHVQIQEIAAHFDPDAYAAARQREAELRAEQAKLAGELSGLQKAMTETKTEVDELETAEQALAAEQDAMTRHKQLLTLAEFIREVIRQAGPYVTRRLMQQVSLEAARLFAEVMTDYTARLRWEENYEIVLEKNGRDRRFQQLSGGEQMAAALAVRLALLRELSAVDVAFFDEPTSNLDDARRDSLAEQILSVKGFSQLFVISHDDTFERVTHHIIRVRKEDGVSKVEAL